MERNGYTSGALISRFNDLSRKCVDIHFYILAQSSIPFMGVGCITGEFYRIFSTLTLSYYPRIVSLYRIYDSSSNRLFLGQFHFPANSSYRSFSPLLFFSSRPFFSENRKDFLFILRCEVIVIGKEERNRGSMKLPPYNNPNIEDRGGGEGSKMRGEMSRDIFTHDRPRSRERYAGICEE